MTAKTTRSGPFPGTVLGWMGFAVAVAAIASGGWNGVPVAVALPGLLLAARIDTRSHVIPNRLLGATAAVFVVAAFAVEGTSALAAALVAGGAAFGALLITLLADPRLGGGDVKLAPLVGALAAWPYAADGTSILACAAIALGALVVGLAGALATCRSNDAVPLARRLTASALAVALVGLLCQLV